MPEKPSGFSFSRRTSSKSPAWADRAVKVSLVVAAVLGVALVSPLSSDVLQFPKTVAFLAFSVLAGFFWILGHFRGGEVKYGRFAWYSALLLAVSAIVALFAEDKWRALLGSSDHLGFSLLSIFGLCLFVFLSGQYLEAKHLRKMRAATVAVMSVIFAVFLARTFLPLPVVLASMGLSPFGTLLSETALAAAVTSLLAFSGLSESIGENNRNVVLYALALALAFSVIVLIGTPSAWAALLMGAAIMLARLVMTVGWKDPAVGLIVVLIVLSAPMALFGSPKAVRLAIPNETRLSVGDSIGVMKGYFTSGVRGPLVGNGFGGYPTVFGAHRPSGLNSGALFSALSLSPSGLVFLSLAEGGVLLALTGLLGLALLVYVVVSDLARTQSQARRSKSKSRDLTGTWSAAALAALVVGTAFVTPSFSTIVLFVIMLVLHSTASGKSETYLLPAKNGAFKILAVLVLILLGSAVIELGRMAVAESYFSLGVKDFAANSFDRAYDRVSVSAKILPDAKYVLGMAQAIASSNAGKTDGSATSTAVIAAIRAASVERNQPIDYHVAVANVARAIARSSSEALVIMRSEADEALALSPSNPALRLWAGDVFAESGDIQAAIASYDQALALRPGFAEAFTRLAAAYAAAGDKDKSVDYLKRAVAAAPNQKEVLGMFVKAATDRKAPGDVESALQAMSDYLAMTPNDAEVIAAFATIAEQDKKPDVALAAYKSLLELYPDEQSLKDKIASLEKPGAVSSSTPPTVVK